MEKSLFKAWTARKPKFNKWPFPNYLWLARLLVKRNFWFFSIWSFYSILLKRAKYGRVPRIRRYLVSNSRWACTFKIEYENWFATSINWNKSISKRRRLRQRKLKDADWRKRKRRVSLKPKINTVNSKVTNPERSVREVYAGE